MSISDLVPGLAPTSHWTDVGACEHFVQFYEDENVLLAAVQGYVANGLANGSAAVVIATRPHLEVLEKSWRESGIQLNACAERGQYVSLDAVDTLAQLMLKGRPQAHRFADVIEPIMAAAAARYPRVAALARWSGSCGRTGITVLPYSSRNCGTSLRLASVSPSFVPIRSRRTVRRTKRYAACVVSTHAPFQLKATTHWRPPPRA